MTFVAPSRRQAGVMPSGICDYVDPPGSSELGRQRLAQLAELARQKRVNVHKPKAGQPEHATVERQAMVAGLGISRFYPKSKTLVNVECLIAMILMAWSVRRNTCWLG